METKSRKARLNEATKDKTFEQLKKIVDEKRKELIKHEYIARGDGGQNNRLAYGEKNKLRLREIRKEIAYILTKMSAMSINRRERK